MTLPRTEHRDPRWRLAFVLGAVTLGLHGCTDNPAPDAVDVDVTDRDAVADTAPDLAASACEGVAVGTTVGCADGFPLVCDGGATPVQSFCPAGEACQNGACAPLEGNVIIIVDTSGSMNYVPERRLFASQCSDEDCPSWTYPDCDDPAAPRTRIGSAKVAIQRFVESPSSDGFRIGLQRFPARPRGDIAPTCNAGYWNSTAPDLGQPSLVTGDTGAHTTLEGGWLLRNLPEILVVPFVASDDRAPLVRWVDWQEETRATGETCVADADCPDALCIDAVCQTFANPELRAIGGTPLGKSLFYAGEIFRHRALVEGRACAADADCGSPHHRCVDDVCTDPLRRCRSNAIVVFTDGVESDNLRLDDFFHPRVQAKRLFAGLGCDSDSDCAGGTTCRSGVCRIPEAALPWPRDTRVCTSGEFSCNEDRECPNACQSVPNGACASTCDTSDVLLTTGGDDDRLIGLDGSQLSIRVHIVDVSGRADSNRLIAAFGGGSHKSVDAADPGAIAAALSDVLTDLKATTRCLAAP